MLPLLGLLSSRPMLFLLLPNIPFFPRVGFQTLHCQGNTGSCAATRNSELGREVRRHPCVAHIVARVHAASLQHSHGTAGVARSAETLSLGTRCQTTRRLISFDCSNPGRQCVCRAVPNSLICDAQVHSMLADAGCVCNNAESGSVSFAGAAEMEIAKGDLHSQAMLHETALPLPFYVEGYIQIRLRLLNGLVQRTWNAPRRRVLESSLSFLSSRRPYRHRISVRS